MKILLPMMILMFSFVVTGCYEDKKDNGDMNSEATEQQDTESAATTEE